MDLLKLFFTILILIPFLYPSAVLPPLKLPLHLSLLLLHVLSALLLNLLPLILLCRHLPASVSHRRPHPICPPLRPIIPPPAHPLVDSNFLHLETALPQLLAQLPRLRAMEILSTTSPCSHCPPMLGRSFSAALSSVVGSETTTLAIDQRLTA